MSIFSKKKPTVMRVIPGEPVAQYGGLTPEQFDRVAQGIEDELFALMLGCSGPLSMYQHLACRMFLLAEREAGVEYADSLIEVFVESLNEAMRLHRAVAAARAAGAGVH